MGNARTRFGLLPKIIVFLAVMLIPLAAVTWYASVRTLRAQMTEEFTSKGTAIANSLASSGVDLILNRDASTVQARVDEVISGKDAISGVAYVMVYDPQKTLIAHTFHPIVPPDLIDKNLVPGETPKQVREIHYAHPVTGAMRSIIDVGVPMLAGQLGTVRVGMDKAIIEAAAAKPGWYLLLMFGGVALLAMMAGAVFARRITRPLGEIVRAAEQVGRGALSHTVRVRSRDEIGQLARTFNDTVTRLRSQVTTETERDEEKRRREDLQKNIAGFLETVTKIAQGDLSRRGEVTPDVLGNVVDAVNLMVEEIATLLADVRHAALRVAGSANDMLGASDQMASGAEKQAREATTVSRDVEAETQEAVVAMVEGTREVEAGYKVTIRAEESLKSIAGISKTSAELAQEISASSQQQVRGADGVVRAMRSIADVAVHTEQAVLQTRRTVDDLVKLADELTRSLSRFKLATN